MKDLYTSLTRAKMAMNDGTLPPMTPLTDRAAALLDPAFTPGMGALEETDRGLRCPLRGCGRYFHFLGNHIGKAHPTVGVAVVREVLGLPQDATLLTTKGHRSFQGRKFQSARARAAGTYSRKGSRRTSTMGTKSIMVLNAMNSCQAQLIAKVRLMSTELGQPPTRRQFVTRFGCSSAGVIRRLFGSWGGLATAAGQQANPPHMRPRWDKPTTLAAFVEWRRVWGRWPAYSDTQAGVAVRQPPIPRYDTIRKIFHRNSWAEIMGIINSVYGSDPVRLKRSCKDCARPTNRIKRCEVCARAAVRKKQPIYKATYRAKQRATHG